MLAQVAPWRFQPHPEVWLLVAGVLALGYYAWRVIGPAVALRSGEPAFSRRQTALFGVAVALLWFSSDWPLHDIGERYLYSAHMVQHLLMSYVVPPLFLLATPTWFARVLLPENGGVVARAVRTLARPIPAGVIFNLVIILQHSPQVVRLAVESGPMHYAMHLLLFGSALLMWMPICGPLPERQISPPAKMLYLFLQSIVPTVPAAWLTFADGVVYRVYDHGNRLWGIGVISDQQSAGAIMKIVGGMYLWVLIAVIFFRWATREGRNDRAARPIVRTATLPDDLTFDEVADTFEQLGPAPPERPRNIGDPRLN